MRKTSTAGTSSKSANRSSSGEISSRPAGRQRLLFALLTFSSLTSGAALAAGGALPTGGHFVGGAGAITQGGKNLTVNQSTQLGIINWQSFSIGKGNSVAINNGKGATLNRVTGSDITTIAGSLKSTGSVYVVNQAGVVVGPSGKVDTSGNFVASTRDVSNTAFMKGGAMVLSGDSSGAVVNQGSITSDSGNVVLVGKSVSNSGTVDAAKGNATLAAGDKVLLQAAGDDAVMVETGSGDVTNSGTVAAAQVALNVKGGNVYALAVNDGGVIRATGTATKGGRIYLTAGDDVTVNGTVVATDADASGGLVQVTATNIEIGGKAKISANGAGKAAGGTILIGGDREGGADRSAALSRTAVAHAETTTVAGAAHISADGGGQGKGGNVVIWSDKATDFKGHITARGGADGGDGGFVEVSSEGKLGFTGRVSTLSRRGKTGMLLLDPQDVTIYNANDTNAPFTNTAASSFILNTTLDTMLASNNVTISTSGGTGGNGDIHFGTNGGTNGSNSAPIFWSSGFNLTLNADRLIDTPGGNPGTATVGKSTGTSSALVNALGTGQITFIAAGTGLTNSATDISLTGDIIGTGGTITMQSTGATYRIEVGNQTTVGNTAANGAGKIVFQGDEVRFGTQTGPTAVITTPGEVDILPTTAGAVEIGDNDPGHVFSNNGNTTLIRNEDMINLTANLVVIGSAATTSITLTNPADEGAAPGGIPVFDAAFAHHLKFLTTSTGSVTQDANTAIVVDDAALNGTGGIGGLAVESGTITLDNAGNSVGSIAFQATSGNISFAATASGTGALNIGTVADISGITTTGAGRTVTLAIAGNSVTQSSGATNAIAATTGTMALELTGSDSSFTLDNTTNKVSKVGANVQSLTLYDNISLTTGTAGATTGVTASGDITIVDSNALTIANGAGIASTGGNIRVEDVTFTNSDGANAFSATGGNWRVYSQDPRNDSADAANLAYSFVQYGATNSYADPFTTANSKLDSNATGNGFLFTVKPTAAETLTGTFDKNYDGSNTVIQAITAGIYSGVTGTINGDVITFNNPTGGSVTATYSTKNVGNNLVITLSPTIAIQTAVDGNGATVYGYGTSVTNNLSGSIAPLPITVTANDRTKTYGQTLTLGSTGFTVTGGMVSGETVDSVTLASLGAAASANAGSYDVNVSNAVGGGGFLASNYTVTYVKGTLTVDKAALTFTPKGSTVTYDGTTLNKTTYSDDLGNYTIAGFQNSQNAGNAGLTLTGSMLFDGSAGTTVKNVNSYSLDQGSLALTSTNYTLTFTNPVPHAYVITPASLTITASNQSKTYGQLKNLGNTAFGATGLASGEQIDTATLSSTGTPASANAGSYDINISNAVGSSGFLASNYNITYVKGTLTVDKAALTFTPNAATVAYDGTTLNKTAYSDDLGNYTINGFKNGQNAGTAGLTLTGSMLFGGSAGTTVKNVATYSQAKGTLSLTSTNYTLTFTNPTPNNYVITPVALSITANDRTKTYGQTLTLGTSQFTVGSGLISGESIDAVTLASAGAAATADAGSYGITASNASGSNGFLASNYTITYNPGALTVSKAALTFAPKGATVTYDGTTLNKATYSDTLGNYTISGFKNGDTSGTSGLTLAGSLLFGGSAGTTVKNVSTYGLGQGSLALTSNDYTLTFDNSAAKTYKINPAALSITANDRSKTYGSTLTLGTTAFTDSGLVAGETLNGVTLASAGAAATADAGSYGITASAATGGNGFLASNYAITYHPGTLTVNKAALTIDIGDQTKTYGQTKNLGTTGFTTGAGQLKNGDTVSTLTLASTGAANTANVAVYDITGSNPTGSGFSTSNYAITYVTGDLTVNPATLTFTPVAVSRQYDGTTLNNTAYSDLLSTYTISGYVNGQNATSAGISLSGSMAFDGSTTTVVKNAATYSQGVGTLALTSDHGNYVLNFTNPTPNNYVITKADVTLADLQGTRVYDGTTNADGSILTIVDLKNSKDQVSVTGFGILASKDVGKEQIVDVSHLHLTGADAGNYTLSDSNPNDFVIVTKATLTVSAVTQTKTYDGTATSTLTPTIAGLQTGDTLTGDKSQSYGSRNVLGTDGSTLTALHDIGVNDGNGGGNYTIVYKTAKGTITPEHVTVTATPNTKTYDGTTTAEATPTVTSGTIFDPDTGTFTESYGTKHAGTGLTLTPTGSITDGNGGGNYIVTFVPISGANPGSGGKSGIIDPAPLTISAVTQTKVYDGTTVSTGTPIITAGMLIAGDTLTNLSQHYNSKNVLGTNGSILSINNDYVLTNASDYAVTLRTAPGTITPLAITATGTRTYDGTPDVDGHILKITDLVPGDDVSIGGTGTSTSPHVGTHDVGGGLTLTGGDSGNYTLIGGHETVKITPFAVILTGTRVYDGDTDGDSGILSVINAFAGDTVTVTSGTSTIVSRNVGDEKIVDFGTLTLGGSSSGDYTLVGAKGNVIVTPETITVTAVPGTKTYDGGTDSNGKPIVTDGTVYGPDKGNFTQTYGSKHAGTGITLTPDGTVDDGNGGGNYIIVFKPITDGVIDPRAVDVFGTRPFNNGTDANSGILTITNLVPGDSVTVGGTSGAVISPAVGDETIVSFTGLNLNGPSSGDYTLVGATGIVRITPVSNPSDNQNNQVPNQTSSGNGTLANFVTDSGIITLTPRQNGVVTGTIATIDGTDYQPDSQLGCTLDQVGCIQNGVAPTNTGAAR